MENANLKILGTAYNEHAEICSFAIGIGRKWIGSITLNGRFFEAKIGPAKGKGLTPDLAARNAWVEFCHHDGGSRYGFSPQAPANVPGRITVRTTKRDRNGEPKRMDVYMDQTKIGTVSKQRNGKFLAVVGQHKTSGACAMSAARLGWIESSRLV